MKNFSSSLNRFNFYKFNFIYELKITSMTFVQHKWRASTLAIHLLLDDAFLWSIQLCLSGDSLYSHKDMRLAQQQQCN